MKRLSIGVRLALWYLAIFALGELVFGAGMWFILRHNLMDIVDDDLETQADDLTRFLQAQNQDGSVAKLQQSAQQTYAIEHSGDYLGLYTESGELIYQSEFLKSHPKALIPLSQIEKPVYKIRKMDGHHFRFLSERLHVQNRIYLAEIGIPADDALETLQLFRFYLLIFAPLLLLVAAGVGYWMSRRALSPVDALVRTAREVSGTNLNSRLQRLNTGDELQRLSDTLNEMLDRIETAFLRVTQFTTDASHELRTPIALMRTEAELALRRSRTEGEYKESLRHILLEAERTTALIEQLLSLARADSGRESLQMRAVNLSEVLQHVVDGWKQIAAIRDLRFSVRVEDRDAFVTGDESSLHRLADILLDNAFKYSASPGSISLSLDSRDEVAIITVQDTGIGIPEDEQSKIFERFYRVDKSRSQEQGGNGLGLAIAEWIVDQHHGSITVESRPGEGATFRVELPKITPPVRNALPV